MPHKKNPDVLELIRGKSARVVGGFAPIADAGEGACLWRIIAICRKTSTPCSTPSTRSTPRWSWPAALIADSTFRAEVIANRLEDGFLDATTLMEYCIAQGVPMRAAHEAVGKLVKLCEQRRCRLKDLSPAEYELVHAGLTPGVYKVLGVSNALAAFRSYGSTSPTEVGRQLALSRDRLAPR